VSFDRIPRRPRARGDRFVRCCGRGIRGERHTPAAAWSALWLPVERRWIEGVAAAAAQRAR